jgi:Rieske Fe-S protein
MQFPNPPAVSRRAVVAGTGGAACAAALSACSTYGPSGPAGTAPAAAPTVAGGTDPGADPGAGAGGVLTSVSEVPVGGGAVLADRDVVVTQPEAGEFRAFSATCTHQGCAVGDVSDGTINCPCHGSRFAIADGSVVAGPADSPLPEREISVTGEDIVLA